MHGKVLIFDDVLRTHSGKRVPWYNEQWVDRTDEDRFVDQALIWFHEGYGTFQLYRLHEVKGDSDPRHIHYICEPLHKYCSTKSENWGKYTEHPELALA